MCKQGVREISKWGKNKVYGRKRDLIWEHHYLFQMIVWLKNLPMNIYFENTSDWKKKLLFECYSMFPLSVKKLTCSFWSVLFLYW